jgi:hypothetical protein
MDDMLTREEVAALITAHTKEAEQLTIIAQQLGRIIESQEKTLAAISGKLDSTGDRLENIQKTQTWISWVVSTVGVVVGLIGLKALAQVLIGKP